MKKVYIASALAICMIVAGVILLYVTKPTELTCKIEHQNYTFLQRNVLKFYDGDRDLAHLTVDALGKKVRFSLWHREGTVVKTLKVKITPDNPSEIYLKTLPSGWKSVRFHQRGDGLSSVFESDDLGVQGEGTVTLEFLVLGSNSKNVTIYYQVEFVMEDGLRKFVGKGEGVLKVCQ
ncbi:hypothetical protein [Archaeoglobus sp.]